MVSAGRRKRRKKKLRFKRRKNNKKLASPKLRYFLYASLALFGLMLLYTVYLDFDVRSQFEGKRWELPARVYARSLELFPGKALTPSAFATELAMLNYRAINHPSTPGSYSRRGQEFTLVTRPFSFWDGKQNSQKIRVFFVDNTIVSIDNIRTAESLALLRLEPAVIAGIYPAHNEDRILIRLDDVPKTLTEGLIAVEDRDFYHHHGIDASAVLRAMLANLRAGRTVQGGSTLTQQLVKNFFLTNERTLWRKLNEAIMSQLLEWHYDKGEILEAYLNEVYLGQDGKRSVHGFGLASHFYFQRPLRELELHQIALLIGIVKGPSYYDPRRHPERTKQRRDLVLDLFLKNGLINQRENIRAKNEPLGVAAKSASAVTAYPAFIDLVRRQLRRDYRDEDLTSEGLQIFTTLDPIVQAKLENSVEEQVPLLEKQAEIEPGKLQTAAIVTSVEQGEVMAIVGDSDPRLAGFNRSLDAVRQIGSLVKPAVYLAALAKSDRYTLATLLDDGPLNVEINGKFWSPRNYDREYHDQVPLYLALAHSYNVSTARLGLEVGLESVIDLLHRLGVNRDIKPYPSLLLGTIAMSPLEVTQMYQTLAANGFRTPLRSILAVQNVDGEPLQRYPLTVAQEIEPDISYLMNVALRYAVEVGTGKALNWILPKEITVAGKTGTTDETRDSWFAGYTGDYLGVVWLGRDDNRSIGLTGSAGALRVWGRVMRQILPRPLDLVAPENIETAWVDSESGWKSAKNCDGSVELPFVKGTVPEQTTACGSNPFNWIRGIFN